MCYWAYESCLHCEILFFFFFLIDKEEAENVKSAAETEVRFVLKTLLTNQMCQVGSRFSHLSSLFRFHSCPGVHKEHRRSADSLLLVRDGKRDSLCPEAERGPLHVCAVRLSSRGQARDPVCRWGHHLWIRGGGVDSAALFAPKI